MIKERRRKRRKRRRILKAVLIVLIVLGLAALIVFKVFTVRNVEITGNELYSDKKIRDWVLNDEYSWNSLYVFFKYKLKETKELPFVDSMEVSLKSPHTLEIHVYEKGVLGYVYVPSLGKNAYFDKDGFVVELSTDVIEGTTKISGLSVKTAKLYEKLPIENQSILRTLLNVTQLLDKYELEPEMIYVTENGQVLLSYGKIQVNVGENEYLNEKIIRLQKIMPQIEGMEGTLHLETWTETTTDIYFEKGQLTEIPNDVQSVPVTEDTSQKDQKSASGGDKKEASEE
ncbi:MAG TPA: FtsQ-type POTRA domain-containing protein [Candidatus Eubacterium avistercoris]|uniref:FtsQ-type POTRA domain-containing protein n=1 Tax=Candidatus Eubacterium avistercoris TaxID=2838567 RepID=A0A9D2D288_9FIRM|nr:FtsQ-type POTRA domain-containing protein [Candidatus Eubacterium avistercoris]